MTASASDVPGRIFISYRREDTAYPAGWLYDRLAGHFTRSQIFKDIDDIDLIGFGDHLVEAITTAVGSCDILLVLIGDRWLTVTGEDGRRRLDNRDDLVRLQIEAALARDVRIIPILVEGARMPRADELPASLSKLARRQALELSPSWFEVGTERLLRVLERTIKEAQEQARKQAEEAARREAEEAARREAEEKSAQRQRQIEQLQGEMRERAAAQDWDAVVAASDELAAVDPAAADPDGLASEAREQITHRQEAERVTVAAQQPQLRRPKMFLCYRREDTQGFARGIYENLASKYGNERVFRDIDSTPPGVRYSIWIESRVAQCSIMIVLIGNTWLSAKDRTGQRRLDSPKDWVRQEIETALRRDIPIVPVCLQGAPMPSEDELPPSIADLTSFQSAEITDSRWAFDMGLLIQAIDSLVASD